MSAGYEVFALSAPHFADEFGGANDLGFTKGTSATSIACCSVWEKCQSSTKAEQGGAQNVSIFDVKLGFKQQQGHGRRQSYRRQ
mmetsp:Transcript_103274/g.287451  ORF Transcript_103274/g.287451 Transcript_103274/m.287451 type:complete len:84 (+) Transcript_103274:515-766(+)